MSKLMQRLFPAAICGLAFLSAGVRSGQAQGVYELRCRGGPEAFSIDRLNETTLSLNFSAIERPAGPLAEGLDSGTCSWIDRALREGEPRQIQFGVSASQAISIPQHLNDSELIADQSSSGDELAEKIEMRPGTSYHRDTERTE